MWALLLNTAKNGFVIRRIPHKAFSVYSTISGPIRLIGKNDKILHEIAHNRELLSNILSINARHLHTSQSLLKKDESKVEQAVKALKESVEEQTKDGKDENEQTKSLSTRTVESVKPATVIPKKKLSQRIIDEVKHYYHGFRLLFIDVRVCSRLIWQVLNGKTLSRRERRQLVTTTSDLFRLVPFLVFMIVPFMEFLIPVALKLFPNMLPSTFQDENRESEKIKKMLKVRLEMAKFLQDTIEDTALTKKRAGKIDEDETKLEEFHKFIESIRTSGTLVSNEQILKYSKLFEDDITLDSLNQGQLKALCRLLGIPVLGNNTLLRFQLRMKLRQLEADDRMIKNEGIDSLTIWELQDACRARGMRALGLSEERLKSQLASWLDLHLNNQVPASLLLLSRTLFMVENLSTEAQLAATLSELPHQTADSAKIKITEAIGERIDNKTKLELIKKEEAAIKAEAKEIAEEEAKNKKEAEQAEAELKEKETSTEKVIDEKLIKSDVEDILVDKAEELKSSPQEVLIDKAEDVAESEKDEEITTTDLEKVETVLEKIAEEKVYELETKELKEDVEEYDRDLAELKDVVMTTGTSEELQETLAAKRLRSQVNKLINQIDTVVTDFHKEKAEIIEAIEVKEVKMKRNLNLLEDQEQRQNIQDQINKKKENLITINELMLGMKRLQKLDDDTKFQKIAEVLDEDGDGAIDLEHAMKVIELLGKENVKIGSSQIAEIVSILKKEAVLEEEDKKKEKEQIESQDRQI
ncbi:DgyrCDS2833 [Dimorphilus gyrociliatus]|uniref:Mitochondrial proton/calcium exchanger protein n=1 Tax=Dimorphilus gyrociliatus TaxID=2664684 RepID=A0A7I8VD92_9ANNE|nr:DgyrCDS2833 [Dimorphilus gyrociliatus]